MRMLLLSGVALLTGVLSAGMASSAPFVVDFEGLPLGTNPNPLVAPGLASFTTASGFNVLLDGFGSTELCPTPTAGSGSDCSLDLTVDFVGPVKNISFLFAGNNDDSPGSAIGEVQVFNGATLLGVQTIFVVDGSAFTPDLVSLTGFTDVSRLVISSTDFNGVVYDDFSFDKIPIPTSAGVPEPASWAMMIAGFALVGGALRRRTRWVESAT
jgi:PEP-CTERM motif-containing protein